MIARDGCEYPATGPYELDPVSRTARWTAASRARESERADHLFADPLAGQLAGQDGFDLVDHVRELLGEQHYLPVRTRWFDEAIGRQSGAGLRQVVFLAADLDTRAFRLPWASDTTVFELDRPELHTWKQAVLADEAAVPRCTRYPVPVDLTGDWFSALSRAGYRPEEPTLWIAEGLLFYLTEEEATRLLAATARCCVSGSVLLADFINSAFRSSALRPLLEVFEQMGAPWRFSADDPKALLAQCGWACAEQVVTGAEAANYGRLPTPTDDEHAPHGFLTTSVRVTEPGT